METRFFAPGGLVSNLDFVESIFGNAGDPVSAAERCRPRRDALVRPHRLRDPGAAPDRPDQEGTRPAALGRRHRAPAPRRHVLAERGRALQRRRRVQDHRRDDARRHRHASSPTTISATARKRSRRRSATPPTCSAARRGTCRRRAGLPQLQPRRQLQPGLALSAPTATAIAGHAAAVCATASTSARKATASTSAIRKSSMCRKTRTWTCSNSRPTGPGATSCASLKLLAGHTYIYPCGFKVASGKASARAELASGRQRSRRHLLLQALHRVRRRQVGDFQVAGQRAAVRPVLSCKT